MYKRILKTKVLTRHSGWSMNDFHLLQEPVPATLFLSYVRLEPHVNKSYEISTVCEECLVTAKRDNKRICMYVYRFQNVFSTLSDTYHDKSMLICVQCQECTGDDGTSVACNMGAEV